MDLAFGFMAGPSEERLSVFSREVWSQQSDGGEVKASIREHLQEHGMFPRCPGRSDTQVGPMLRQMQNARAVGEHRGAGFARVEPPLIDLRDVGHEVGLDSPRLTKQQRQPMKQFFIRKRSKNVCV